MRGVRDKEGSRGGVIVAPPDAVPLPKVPRARAQLAIVVADGSQSMVGELASSAFRTTSVRTKAEAVNVATLDLVSRLSTSAQAREIDFAFIAFNDVVTDVREPRSVTEVAGPFDPTAHGVGGTNYAAGLLRAEQMAIEYLRDDHDGLSASVVVLLLGDGHDTNDPAGARTVAARVRSLGNTTLTTCYLGTRGDPASGSALLQELAGSPALSTIVHDDDELRRWFLKRVTADEDGREVRGGGGRIGHAAVLRAAEQELVSTNGELEMAAVAARAGVTTEALYFQFGSRADLLDAVIREYHGRHDRSIAPRSDEGGDWYDRLFWRTERIVAFHYADPLAPVIASSLAREPAVAEVQEALVHATITDLADAQRSGEVPPEVDCDLVGALVVGATASVVRRALSRAPRPDPYKTSTLIWSAIVAVAR